MPRVVVASATGVVGTRLARVGADNIAVVWTEGVLLKLAIHSAGSGAVVASEAIVATLSSSDVQGWNLATLPGGDIVLAYGKSSNDLVFKRFNAAGVLQGGETTVEAGSSPAYVGVLALRAGGFVVHHYRYAAGTAYKFARFSANGTQQGVLATLAAGSPHRTVSPSERNAMELNQPFMLFDRAGTGPLMAVHTVGAGFTTYLYSWNADLTAVENTLVLSTSGSYPLSYAWTEVLSSGMLVSVACGQPSSGAAQINVSIPQASSILGIAQEAVLPGSMVRVATAGKFATTQSFSSPAFDRRSATPPGTRGMAIGNTAILGGLMD